MIRLNKYIQIIIKKILFIWHERLSLKVQTKILWIVLHNLMNNCTYFFSNTCNKTKSLNNSVQTDKKTNKKQQQPQTPILLYLSLIHI